MAGLAMVFSEWQVTIDNNGRFHLTGTHGNVGVAMTGRRTLCQVLRRPRATESNGHLCDLPALFRGGFYLSPMAGLGSFSWPFSLT